MADQSLYITRPEGEDLYTVLQRKTLEQLQRISGKVWTDYNPHDPGVTVADTVNYALTETDYKLNFDLEDYLTDPEGTWQTGIYGLFPASRVYPTTPFTPDDYRRLILAHFPMVQNVTVAVDRDAYAYNFILRLSPFYDDETGIVNHVRNFLNRHRNLCENIGKVEAGHPKELTLETEFGILPGYNATEILVQIYWNAMQYLSGSIQLKMNESGYSDESCSPDIWYDGPVKDVRVVIPEQENTEYELYKILSSIDGIREFKTCWFKDKDGLPITDFKDGYMLLIPDDFRNVKVKMRNEPVYADVDEFKERLKALYFMRSTLRLQHSLQKKSNGQNDRNYDSSIAEPVRKACYRNVYDHHPVSRELPQCYHAADTGFGNYLRLFDLLMTRGLEELNGLKKVLSLKDNDFPEGIPVLPEGEPELRNLNDRIRIVTDLKNQYMDFLDGLYGVESAPVWLKEFDYYSRSESTRLRRRMAFLRELPELIRNRSQGMDITGAFGGKNIPTIKRYLSLLLDFNCDEEFPVGNILPGHNLILMGEGEKGQRIRDLMNSTMIDDPLFVSDTVEAIEPDEPPRTKTEKLDRDEDLRRHLPIFNSNWISGALFREGIRLSAYNLVKVGNGEWLLIFQGREEQLRMNLGRSDDKQRLRSWANTLCRYLRDLNHQSEAVYIVEKSLFDAADPLTIQLVFTGWTARTHSMQFRDSCTHLVRSLLPAHLKMEICWLHASQMQQFEDCYRKWHDCLAGRLPEDMKPLLEKKMTDIIEKQI